VDERTRPVAWTRRVHLDVVPFLVSVLLTVIPGPDTASPTAVCC